MTRIAVVVVALVALTAPASAQKPTDLKTRVDALDRQIAELSQLAAQAGSAGAAVQELSAKVGALEHAIEALGRAQDSHTALVARGDELERRVAAAEQAAASLAARLGDVEQPSVSSGGAVAHDKGFVLATADGRYTVTIGGYVQPRLDTTMAEELDAVDAASFRLRRARLSLAGKLGGSKLGYKVMAELRDPATTMMDAYVDYEIRPELVVRVGQTKLPFTRLWLTSSTQLDFLERTVGLDNLRYDRDLGVWLRGKLDGGKLTYMAGLSNGAGRNAVNDNIDFVMVARVDRAILGPRFEGYGDLERSAAPRLMVGAGVAHDLVRLPDTLAGIEVGERDVDQDGVGDNVRVLSASADVAGRFRGVELSIEGFVRQERWGTILDHGDNAALADAVQPSGRGRRNYVGGYAAVSYLALDNLLVGARLSHTRLSLLGVGGQTVKAVPPTDRLVELDLTCQLYQDGHRSLGAGYSLTNYDARAGADPDADKAHRFIVEYQWML